MDNLYLFPNQLQGDGIHPPIPQYDVSQKSKHRRARKLNIDADYVPNKRICINLSGVRSKPKPYRMLLDSDDEDAFYEGSDSDHEEGHVISQINGRDLLTFNEDQERSLIPSTKTYNIDIYKKNEFEIGHRLLIAPKKRNIGDNIDFNFFP